MKVKAIKSEWFQDYKLPSMFIAFPYCSYKCEVECGEKICQNSHLATQPIIEVNEEELLQRYINNPITKAIVCGGLEPFDSFSDLYTLIDLFRNVYHCDDTVVIYTGYNVDEIYHEVAQLSKFQNIIVKFGRFIPKQQSRFDNLLGVKLASNNQFAISI